MRWRMGMMALLCGLLCCSAPGMRAEPRAGDAEAIALAAARRPNSAYTLPPARLAEAVRYSRDRTVLEFAGEGWGMLVLLVC